MNPVDFEHLRYDLADGVAVVTLHRPDRRNAWSGPMAVEYRWALHHAHTDPAARVVVVTGAGGDFCVGADTRILGAIDAAGGTYARPRADLPPYPDGTPEGLRHNHCFPLTIDVPVIAAIEGACAGAGFVLATYADLRWAAADAKITSTFARLGLPAEYGIGWLLARQVGAPNALRLLWSADVLDGPSAAALGWVQECTEPGAALEGALAFARTIARESSPRSLATMKRAVLVDAEGDLGAAYERSVADMEATLAHPDFGTGLQAQRDRERPDFLASPDDGSDRP